MSKLFPNANMQPIIILPEGAMDAANIDLLRQNGLCVVVAKDPALVKFVDPIPAISSRSKIEDAAIRLSRKVMNPGFWSDDNNHYPTRSAMTKAFVDILVRGTPLDPNPTQQEQEKSIFDQAKVAELQRLAREEAKEERDRAKAERQKSTKGTTP